MYLRTILWSCTVPRFIHTLRFTIRRRVTTPPAPRLRSVSVCSWEHSGAEVGAGAADGGATTFMSITITTSIATPTLEAVATDSAARGAWVVLGERDVRVASEEWVARVELEEWVAPGARAVAWAGLRSFPHKATGRIIHNIAVERRTGTVPRRTGLVEWRGEIRSLKGKPVHGNK